jgi:ubiquinone/menaquinone biosynthesis C-methylase UbiE
MSTHRVLPRWDLANHSVLDVGCHDGRHLAALDALERFGVDVDAQAIDRGKREYPGISLDVAPAESLPFPSASMDTVFSKVALPYTDIPRALREMHRVLKPGGQVLLSLHDWQLQRGWLVDAFKHLAIKRIVDHAYIFTASAMFNLFGFVPARPWNGTRETFQTQRAMVREIKKAGLELVKLERTPHDFVIHARKAGPAKL